VLLFAVAICSADAADRETPDIQKRDVNRDSIVAEINSVTVLRFETDKPISHIRLFLDGEQIYKQVAQTNKTGLHLAVVPMNDRMEIHAKVGDQNQLFSAKLPRVLRADILERESFGPGKSLELAEWTEVFSIARSDFEGKNHGHLKLEPETVS
jgi:hypothetical protein